MTGDVLSTPNMAVSIGGGIVLKNPVMTASGTFGYGEEFSSHIDLSRLGGIVVKGLSLRPRAGNRPPRIMETSAGMLNAIGLENVGVEAFIAEKMKFLRTLGTAIVANIFGDTPKEYGSVAERLNDVEGVTALEVNISCPNVKTGGVDLGADPVMAGKVTRIVRKATDLPIIVKLTPNVTDIGVVARSVEEAGADALSLINTLKGMSVDIESRRPHLGNITGGLSGPAVKPVALRMVWEAVRAVSIPVIGIGGIMNHEDALEFLITGASAVQVGTANFINPAATIDIIEGMERWLENRGIADVNQIVGTLDLS